MFLLAITQYIQTKPSRLSRNEAKGTISREPGYSSKRQVLFLISLDPPVVVSRSQGRLDPRNNVTIQADVSTTS